MNKQVWQTASLFVLLSASLDSRAVQRKEVRDGLAVEAIISEREPTRIRVENAKITGVVGRLAANNDCNMVPEAATPAAQIQPPTMPASANNGAEASITCDLSKGEVYLQPQGTGKKPINLFVTTDHATYTLVLRRADLPADTIVLFDPSAPLQVSKNGQGRAAQPQHVKGIKAMLKAMVAKRPPSDIQAEDVRVPLILWQEADLHLVRNYRGRGYLGERYLLTNTSAAPMTLSEQEFDRDGQGVVAVAIDNMNLRPGETTSVYVIRSEVQP